MDNKTLTHFGIKGMKWGVRRSKTGYKSTSIKAAKARRANDKVDRGFKDWEANAKKKETAIALGKKATQALMAYENDKSNKDLKAAYKSAKKEYKQALNSNTTYRKGSIRQEVGRDMTRNYLSSAKKVKKQLDADPSNKQLQKKYNSLMSKHDVERYNSRRAADVGAKRSARKASIKRGMTMSMKAAVATAATAGTVHAVNRLLQRSGKGGKIGAQTISQAANAIKRGRDFMGYIY